MITIGTISEELKEYGWKEFDTIFQLRPEEKGRIIINDQTEIESSRWHKSYLSTPRWESFTSEQKEHNNYMFSGINGEVNEKLPPVLQPFLDFVNKNETVHYNQVTVNWFEDGENFIPMHIDCKIGMQEGVVTTISLGGSREFRYKMNTKRKETDLSHGDMVTLSSTIRHGIPKSSSTERRVSLSFRKYS